MTSKFEHFLVLCSGANMEILKNCPRSESIKQAGIGGTILITSILAFFSGSYALFTVFENYLMAVAFGIVWALMIFNLDRLIVSSMRKKGTVWNQFKMATPRILLAIVIAMVISKPLEVKLLETRIQKEIFDQNKERSNENTEKIQTTSLTYRSQIDALDTKIENKKNQKPEGYQRLEDKKRPLEEKIKKLTPSIRKKNKPLYDDIKTSKVLLQSIGYSIENEEEIKRIEGVIKKLNKQVYRNKGPIRRIEREIKLIDDEIDRVFALFNSELQALKEEVQEEKENLRLEGNETVAEIKNNAKAEKEVYQENSLIDLIEALSDAGDKNQIVSLVSLFIMLLFIVVETVPIFVKLISPRGPYDELLDAQEHKFYVQALDSINEENRKLNKKISVLSSIDENEMNQELANNKEVLQAISEAHLDIIKLQLENWAEDEKKKFRTGYSNGTGNHN